jgi:hypothetical protein
MKTIIVVTNNPMSKVELEKKCHVEFVDGSTMEVYQKARDYIHAGHRLLTHPIMSSIKPNQTPYRTVVITGEAGKEVDIQSLHYIEEAIHTLEKFLMNFGIPVWTEKILEDFQLIDFDLIYHAIS